MHGEEPSRSRIMVIEFNFQVRLRSKLMFQIDSHPLFLRLSRNANVIYLHPKNSGRLDNKAVSESLGL